MKQDSSCLGTFDGYEESTADIDSRSECINSMSHRVKDKD